MVMSSGNKYLTHRKKWTDPKKPEPEYNPDGSPTNGLDEPKGWFKRLMSRSKTIYAEHKLIAVTLYYTMNFGGWGVLYLAFVNNLLDVSWIGADQIAAFSNMIDSGAKYIGVSTNFPELILTDPRYMCGVLSGVANEFLEPARIVGVVALTPILAAYIKGKPLPSPPPPPPSS
jgi:hypothetical protein